jgi:hypothetical protein
MHIGVAAGRTAWARAAVQPRRPLGAQIARRIARPPRAEGAGGDRDNESRSVEEEALDVISRGVLRAYDAAARAQRESLHELEKELAAAKKTTQEMRDASVWRPLINVMEYLTTWYADRLESTKASVADTAAQRAELLRTLTADPGAAPPDFSAFPGAAGGSESALEEAFGIVITSLVLASVASWGAGLCGLQAAELLPDPSAFDPAAATAWAAWTAPYVGATAALGLAAPRLLGGDGVLRFGDVSPRFFSQLAPAGLVSVAAVVAYSQALVWQGAWLQAALRAAGAGDAAQLLADPSLAGPDLAQSLGGLVAAPRLLAPLVAPTAVAVVAAGQAGWWALRAGAKNLLATCVVPPPRCGAAAPSGAPPRRSPAWFNPESEIQP